MSATKRAFDEQQAYPHAAAQAPAASGFQELLEQPVKFSPQMRTIILDTCCSGATREESEELIAIAEARGLNPIAGECYFVKRWDNAKRREVWAVQASIDAMRIKAEESGLYAGQDEPEFEYDAKGAITLARVRVYRKDWPRPMVGVARFSEYVQTTKEGAPTKFWKNMPHNQLAKCAEALALRKAFPKRFARIYTPDEMAQAANDATPAHDPQTGEVRETAPKPAQVEAFNARLARIHHANTIDEIKSALAGAKRVVTPEQAAELSLLAADRRKIIEAADAETRAKSAARAEAQDDGEPPADYVSEGRQPGED